MNSYSSKNYISTWLINFKIKWSIIYSSGIEQFVWCSLMQMTILAKKSVCSYLSLLVNSKDDLAVAHILNVPDRGLGREAFTNLKHASQERKMSIFLVCVSNESSWKTGSIKKVSKQRMWLYMQHWCLQAESNATMKKILKLKINRFCGEQWLLIWSWDLKVDRKNSFCVYFKSSKMGSCSCCQHRAISKIVEIR